MLVLTYTTMAPIHNWMTTCHNNLIYGSSWSCFAARRFSDLIPGPSCVEFLASSSCVVGRVQRCAKVFFHGCITRNTVCSVLLPLLSAVGVPLYLCKRHKRFSVPVCTSRLWFYSCTPLSPSPSAAPTGWFPLFPQWILWFPRRWFPLDYTDYEPPWISKSLIWPVGLMRQLIMALIGSP